MILHECYNIIYIHNSEYVPCIQISHISHVTLLCIGDVQHVLYVRKDDAIL